ncbi:hypothetical protein KW95_04345 [Clostridioides difficile]|nr:hypothetical protein KW95_04345 [Clostridioides difficile]
MDNYFNQRILEKISKEDLLKMGLDIEDENIFQSEKYKKLRYIYVVSPVKIPVSVDYYIEKYLLSKEQINNIRKGKFDINSDKEIKLSFSELNRELSNEKITSEEENFENIKKKMDILIKNLRKYLDYDIKKFKNEKYQILKLIKLIYNINSKNKKRLYYMLKNPSLEWGHNKFHNQKTEYGEIIAFLKNESMKEIDDINFIKKAELTIFSIYNEFGKIINEFLEDCLEGEVYEYKLQYINNVLKSIIDELPNEDLHSCYEHSVFETFYLKLLQYEIIGEIKDSISIAKFNHQKKEKASEIYVYKYKKILHEKVKIDNVSYFIKENIDRVSELFYMKSNVSKEEKKYLTSDTTIKYINNFIDIWKCNTRQDLNKEDTIPLLNIISALQEIKYSKIPKKSCKNNFEKNLMSNLKKGVKAPSQYKLLWINKVDYRIFINLDKEEDFYLISSIHINSRIIIEYIMKSNSINSMVDNNLIILEKLLSNIFSNNFSMKYLNDIRKKVFCISGYKISAINTNVLFNCFEKVKEYGLGKFLTEDILDNIKIFQLEIEIKKKIPVYINPSFEKLFKFNLVLNSHKEDKKEFVIYYKINLNERIINLINFKMIKK